MKCRSYQKKKMIPTMKMTKRRHTSIECHQPGMERPLGETAHHDNDSQNIIETAMMEKSVVATSLDDPLPAEVPIKNHFELDDTNLIYRSPMRTAPLHNYIVCKEPDKMLEAAMVWSFLVVIVSKRDSNTRFCVD